ncbi:MAG: 4Fe-4S dicluster domain-containing protein [Firmicutes bacterium]|nr:4Fe-4S dicluster domain-containing protein [Bacillota bacterium]
MARYVMVINTKECVRCRTCYVACKVKNSLPIGKKYGTEYHRLSFLEEEIGTFPNVKRTFYPTHCNHCNNPACLKACPVGAIYKADDGRVLTDGDKCIQCGRCVEACPYQARFINEEKGKADHCDYCFDRGTKPACAELCPAQCIYFGDLDDPNSEVSKLLATGKTKVLKPSAGTDPQVYYID